MFSVLIVAVGLGAFVYSRYFAVDEYKVTRYVYSETGENVCLALDPSCGYCPGEVRNKECYVDLNKLSKEEKQYLGL